MTRSLLTGAVVAALAVLFATAPSLAGAGDENKLIRIANGLDVAVDAKDWEQARSYFADEITFLVGPADGAEPTRMAADDLITTWRTNLFAEKSSFHLRGNHVSVIDGDAARMTSHGYAWNKLPGLEGGEFWEVWGVYRYQFEKLDGAWKLTGFHFEPTHERGNSAVPTALQGEDQ